MKFRWRAWLTVGGLSRKVVRSIASDRIQYELQSISGSDNGYWYSVDLLKKIIVIKEEQ